MNRVMFSVFTIILVNLFFAENAISAISLDRTRIVFDGKQKSLSVTVSNKNKQLPYLAQAWMDNENGEKITSPFVVLPPVQRIEPDKTSQVRIDSLPEVSVLPQDRESVFYFNLREIPPRSNKPNVLQFALQSKIKFFYRPEAIAISGIEVMNNPWQNKLELTIQEGGVNIKNPTPYYATIINAHKNKNYTAVKEFNAVMIPPFGNESLGVSVNEIGTAPVLTYINDFGGRIDLQFKCVGQTCKAIPDKK
ncbi:TPA: fimbria/pilus periplasmic chaperone [Morganella morganii]|nr:fimbria/pilus periplasmic chaperone [Morganella morganii]